MKATLCSRNAHKARELEVLLPGWTIEPLDANDYPPETSDSYYENARTKAAFGRTRLPGWTLGEDSGLEVAALGGRPGLESARYAPEGAPAIAKLLRELEGVEDRRARYVSELVALAPAPTRRAAAAASATTRSSSPTARSGRSPSSATRGRRGTRIEPARCRRYGRASAGAPARSARRSAFHQFSSAPQMITFAIT